MTLGEFQSTYAPGIDWTAYLESFMPQKALRRLKSKNGGSLERLEVGVRSVELFSDLTNLIRSTPAQVMSDYLEVHLLLGYVPFLDERFLSLASNFTGMDFIAHNRDLCKQLAF